MKYFLLINLLFILSGCVKSEFVKCKEFVIKDVQTIYTKDQIEEGLKQLNLPSIEAWADQYCRATINGLPWNRGN